jgi:hypothetical protein
LCADAKIFITADVIALLIQAGGGAIASISKTHAGASRGGKIMLVGIVIQFGEISPLILRYIF